MMPCPLIASGLGMDEFYIDSGLQDTILPKLLLSTIDDHDQESKDLM